MSTTQNLTVNWTNVPAAIAAGGVEFAYRELGTNHPGTPVVFLIHLAAVLDNWDPRLVDALAAGRHVVTFDNRVQANEIERSYLIRSNDDTEGYDSAQRN